MAYTHNAAPICHNISYATVLAYVIDNTDTLAMGRGQAGRNSPEWERYPRILFL